MKPKAKIVKKSTRSRQGIKRKPKTVKRSKRPARKKPQKTRSRDTRTIYFRTEKKASTDGSLTISFSKADFDLMLRRDFNNARVSDIRPKRPRYKNGRVYMNYNSTIKGRFLADS